MQALADGLDRALAGLGQPDAAQLDLGQLLDYDRQVITGLDLTVDNAQRGSFLGRFELHMGGEKPSILLKGVDGEMCLSVDAGAAAAGAPTDQRAEALRGLLARIDAASSSSMDWGGSQGGASVTTETGTVPSARSGRQSDILWLRRHLAVADADPRLGRFVLRRDPRVLLQPRQPDHDSEPEQRRLLVHPGADHDHQLHGQRAEPVRQLVGRRERDAVV